MFENNQQKHKYEEKELHSKVTDDIWTDTEGHFFRWQSTKKNNVLMDRMEK